MIVWKVPRHSMVTGYLYCGVSHWSLLRVQEVQEEWIIIFRLRDNLLVPFPKVKQSTKKVKNSFSTAGHLKMARIDFGERVVTCYNPTSRKVPQKWRPQLDCSEILKAGKGIINFLELNKKHILLSCCDKKLSDQREGEKDKFWFCE